MLTTRRRLARMNRSLAAAAAAICLSRSRPRSPAALRRRAAAPSSIVRESSRSSSAFSSATAPISFRYIPTESLIRFHPSGVSSGKRRGAGRGSAAKSRPDVDRRVRRRVERSSGPFATLLRIGRYHPPMAAGSAPGAGAGPGRRIGVFGGTFDPPHVGHLVPALFVAEALALDVVLLVVANVPWQKVGSRPISPARDRLDMVRAAVDGVDVLEASDLEIRRGGDTFTVDTIAELRAQGPDDDLVLILGSDAASGLDTWERP